MSGLSALAACPSPSPDGEPAAPGPTLPPAVAAKLARYAGRFPTIPAWFASLEPDDIADDYDFRNVPCMADAEDGEQPWDDSSVDADGNVRPGYVAFPFVGPPPLEEEPEPAPATACRSAA